MHAAIASARCGELNQLLAPYLRSDDSPKIYEGNVVEEFDAAGQSAGFLCLFYDVTERERMQVELRHAASHDSLTGLSNRLAIEDRLENAVARSEREHLQFAVLAVDLDGFKPINDQYGHAAGDAMLIHVARQLSNAVRSADSVARVGGDEFVVVLENVQDPAAVKLLVEKILAAISTPVIFGAQPLAVSASVGIATFPAHATRPRELLRVADEAMYQAKRAGKNCMRFGASAVPPAPTFESPP
jgi:diguanylate cyclase (GGDEF)-like protein